MKTKKEKLIEELIESSKSQEDKLAAARVITNKDSQKTANAIKSLMGKKWLEVRNTGSFYLLYSAYYWLAWGFMQ